MKSAGSFSCDSVAGSHCPERLSGLLCLLLPPLLKADVFLGNVAAFQVLREKSLSLEVGRRHRTESLPKCALSSPSLLFFHL